MDKFGAAAKDKGKSDARLHQHRWKELAALVHWTVENCLTDEEGEASKHRQDETLSDDTEDDGEDESEEYKSDAKTGSEEDSEGVSNSEDVLEDSDWTRAGTQTATARPRDRSSGGRRAAPRATRS